MTKLFPILLMCSALASGAFAQTAGGVTTSNDPAKVAAVEKHAQELKAQQQANAAAKPAAKSTRTAGKAMSKAKKTGSRSKPAAKK
jgi:hypothetical protein